MIFLQQREKDHHHHQEPVHSIANPTTWVSHKPTVIFLWRDWRLHPPICPVNQNPLSYFLFSGCFYYNYTDNLSFLTALCETGFYIIILNPSPIPSHGHRSSSRFSTWTTPVLHILYTSLDPLCRLFLIRLYWQLLWMFLFLLNQTIPWSTWIMASVEDNLGVNALSFPVAQW